ncbi:hypothetical protein [Pseudomonas matsuisoli]|uniref:Uncharacterized protein n=1 Tax=Pseudomonas matsuisoli TaxID=1515666 RepID=A0A917PN33_9PSED|nr:hypothetical protein [Pseudomonas matsuisoli]GGJ85736.1 hypothetical protein GCM10009304_09750 [Pseudomonas matsuisoli]
MRVESHNGARRLSPEATPHTDAVHRLVPPTQGAARESFERAIRARRSVDVRSLLREIQDATLPRLEDTSILGGARSIEVLDYLIQEVLPSLGHDVETSRVIEKLLSEELDQQCELMALLEPEMEAVP